MDEASIIRHSDQEDVSDYKFIDFCKQTFQQNAPYFYKKGLLMEPLLLHSDKMHNEAALSCNVVLHRFMYDLPEPKNLGVAEESHVFKDPSFKRDERSRYPGNTFKRKAESIKKPTWTCIPPVSSMSTKTTNLEKVRFIASYGMFIPALREEIYCQLCKQLTNNPSRISRTRGWILMGILVGVFPPSGRFLNYLRCFLRDGPDGYDVFCSARLSRTLEHQTIRKQTPTYVEMQASAKKTLKIIVPVTLMNGSSHECEVDPATTCKELCTQIQKKIGMKSVFGFSIYATSRDQITNWGNGEECVFDAISFCEQYAVYKGQPENVTNFKLYMRKNVFLSSHSAADDPVETDLIYWQMLGGLHLGEYRCSERNDLVDIIAKRYYIENGAVLDLDEVRNVVKKTATQSSLNEDPALEDELVGAVENSYDSIPCVRNASSRELVKAEVVQDGLSRWAQSFCKVFDAILISGPKVPIGRVTLSIHATGITIQTSREDTFGAKPFLLNLDYEGMIGVSGKSHKNSRVEESQYLLTIVASEKRTYTFKAMAAAEILDLVDQLMEDRKASRLYTNNNNN